VLGGGDMDMSNLIGQECGCWGKKSKHRDIDTTPIFSRNITDIMKFNMGATWSSLQ
jgi:hypothetical protein